MSLRHVRKNWRLIYLSMCVLKAMRCGICDHLYSPKTTLIFWGWFKHLSQQMKMYQLIDLFVSESISLQDIQYCVSYKGTFIHIHTELVQNLIVVGKHFSNRSIYILHWTLEIDFAFIYFSLCTSKYIIILQKNIRSRIILLS